LHSAPRWRHARAVRHATEQDLDRIEVLLTHLRQLPQLRERKRGYFSRESKAFIHFHEQAGELYVDARLGTAFGRMRVTTGAEHEVFLSRVHEALRETAGGRSVLRVSKTNAATRLTSRSSSRCIFGGRAPSMLDLSHATPVSPRWR
jgi:hypothetical protein